MSSLGPYLRTLREQRGISLDEVARTTRVSRQYVEALESGDFARLPAPVFVRGFILAYCEALAEPPDQALAHYTARTAGTDAAPGLRAARDRVAPERGRAPVLVSFVLLIVLGFALFGVSVLLQSSRRTTAERRVNAPPRDMQAAGPRDAAPAPLAPATRAPSVPSPAPPPPAAVLPATPALPGPSAGPPSPTVPALVNRQTAAPPSTPPGAAPAAPPAAALRPEPAPIAQPVSPTAQPAPPPAEPVAATAPPIPPPAEPVAPPAEPVAPASPPAATVAQQEVSAAVASVSPPYRLTARTTAPTWLRVRTDDGRQVDETIPAGEVREWVSNRPFTVTIGNAGGVKLELNGRPLPALGAPGAVITRLVVPPSEAP